MAPVAPVQIGTKMPVPTDSSQFPVFVVGGSDVIPKMREKRAPDGRPTFSSGAILLVERAGMRSADKLSSVHVISPDQSYSLGVIYRAEGKIWVMPYVPEGSTRQALSITVERLVPVNPSQEK